MSERKRGLKSNPLFDKTEQPEEPMATSQTEETSERAMSEAASSEPRAEEKPTTQSDQSGEQTDERPNDQTGEQPAERSTDRPTDSSIDQPVDRQTDQSTDQSTDLSVELSTRSVMSRPTAFYLYEEQDEELDELVRRLKKKYRLKTDRSALMRAILTEPVLNYHDETSDRKLVDRLLKQETNRLIGR